MLSGEKIGTIWTPETFGITARREIIDNRAKAVHIYFSQDRLDFIAPYIISNKRAWSANKSGEKTALSIVGEGVYDDVTIVSICRIVETSAENFRPRIESFRKSKGLGQIALANQTTPRLRVDGYLLALPPESWLEMGPINNPICRVENDEDAKLAVKFYPKK